MGKLWSITLQMKMSATTNEIENEILFCLNLHLVWILKQKVEIISGIL